MSPYSTVALAILLAASCASWVRAARILVVAPHPSPSHASVFAAISKALALRGHDITCFCAMPFKDMPPSHKVIPVGNLIASTMNNSFAEYFKNKANPVKSSFHLWTLGERLVNGTFALPEIQEHINRPGNKYDMVMAETFLSQEGFAAIAHKLDAKLVSIATFGTSLPLNEQVGNPVNPSWIPSLLLGYTDHMSFHERTVNALLTLFHYAGLYLYHLPKQQYLVSKYFPDAPPLPEILRTRNVLNLVNNHHTLFYPAPIAPNVIEVGGMHIKHDPKPLPKDLRDFMDGAQNGVVYFSLGSYLKLEFLPKHKAEAILTALSSLNQQVLVKWDGPAPNVSSNIRIVNWVPQSDLLAHPNLRVFVTHGGLLSTQEAVFHGVPVVGIPVFGDQHFNVRLAVNKGFCVEVDLQTITKKSLSIAVREVIENPKYAEAARMLSSRFRSRPQTPLDSAVFWVEHVLEHGGEHLRPSCLGLSWHQLLLLDVLLVLLTPALLLMCACFLCGRRRNTPLESSGSSSKKKTD